MAHAISWFEIPATNLDRAYDFYHRILDGHVRRGTFGNGELILFDVPFHTGEAVGGSVVVRPDLVPTTSGGIMYLTAWNPLNVVTGRVTAAGGQVLVPEINLGKFGYAAIIIDTEGNKIGLLAHEA
jgi:hypothetical protein